MSKNLGQELDCDNPECGKKFVKRVWNQRFCGKECMNYISNQQVLARYYIKKQEKLDRDNGRRICSILGCGTILSRYNEDDECALHSKNLIDFRI